MNVKSRKLWVAGIVSSAIAVGLVYYLTPRNDLTVEVVDPRFNKPLTNLSVTVTESHRVPVISSLTFLPSSLRGYMVERSFDCRDGTFQVPRISLNGAVSVVFLTLTTYQGVSLNTLESGPWKKCGMEQQ